MNHSAKPVLLSAYRFFPSLGGLEQQLWLIAHELISRGFQVEVLTEKHEPNQKSMELFDGIKVIRLPFVKNRHILNQIYLAGLIAIFLWRNRGRYQFALVRAALTLYSLVFGLLKRLKILAYPTWVSADTGGDNDEVIQLRSWPMANYLIWAAKGNSIVNAICFDNQLHFLQLGFLQKQISTINNGVKIETYARNHYPSKIRRFVYSGRLIKQKGIFELLAAFALCQQQVPACFLSIVGDGPEMSNLIKLVENLGLKKQVKFWGKIESNKMAEIYAQHDCLVLPSYSEAFPMSVAEAIVAKRLVIATDVGEIRRFYGKQVIYCRQRDVEDLSAQMIAAVQNYQSNQLNYDAFIEKLDIRQVVDRILATLQVNR